MPASPLLQPPDAELLAMVQNWGRIWNLPGLAAHVHIEWSRRQTASAGRCQPSTGRIRLNAGLNKADVISTLCHEAAHVAVYLLHGRDVAPHGPEWRDLMTLAGASTRPLEKTKSATVSRPVFLHRCPYCHYTRRDRARSPRWACPVCLEAGQTSVLEVVAEYRQ